MLDGIAAAEILRGVRGAPAGGPRRARDHDRARSRLVADFPEIAELDLNPVFATERGATAADVRVVLDFNPAAGALPAEPGADRAADEPHHEAGCGRGDRRLGRERQDRQFGDEEPHQRRLPGRDLSDSSERRRDPGQESLQERQGRAGRDRCGGVRHSGQVRRPGADRGGREEDPRRGADPVGLCRDRQCRRPGRAGRDRAQVRRAAHGARTSTASTTRPKNLCATFCTAYDVKGKAALSSQSGGIGMAIIGFSRSAKMGVSAIVGLGNKSDIDEDDLLTFFEQDDNTQIIAQHCEDLKDGRAFAEVAKRVSKKKPVVVLKAGRTSMGARAASSHTGALAGNDKIYEDVFKQSGVIRARSLRDLLEFARGIPVLPTPKGNNVVIITGAGGSGVLLSDACVDNGLSLMAMPPDLDAAFRKFIPPFGAAGNPVDITGGEPPTTYQNTVRLGLEDPRIHALILGYWHTIITPPMVFARLMVEVVERDARQGHREARGGLAGRATSKSRRRRSTCISTAFRPMPIRPRFRSRCWARSIAGRAAPD